ncbi:STAS/SEC14 domain-containing protein [Saprospira grandis]|uniref:DUF7793 domain-containing protein n=1 Tax=Saprospira grandis (strain Lewin) TaxID=984262 RepID=H6L5W0_SAPGL|nr:STAS/SEC14 domain-containing protein [Saprospira grandis]AFC26360.1 hypothetical protein SGRA_3636 [Saprospira grandis str. Lewin]
MKRDYSAPKIEFPQAKLQWSAEAEGVLELYFEQKLKMSLEQAQDYYESLCKMAEAQGKNIFIYIDVSTIGGISADARKYFAKAVNPRSRACALLVGSGISRILGNFLVGFNKPPIPTRLFSNKEKALQWLAEWQRKTP